MQLRELYERIKDKNIIPTLPDRSISKLDEYCNMYPSFERTVRHIASLFRYIPFSELLDTIDYLVNNVFIDVMREELDKGNRFVFMYDYKDKSSYYFSILFLKYLALSLEEKYWDMITLDNELQDNAIHVFVDDGAYSGTQLIDRIHPHDNPIAILISCSRFAYNRLTSHHNDMKVYVGEIFEDVFPFGDPLLFRDWEILYETDGIVYPLLGSRPRVYRNAVSGFYFQHKFPDEISIPQYLLTMPIPDNVDRILTLKEKYTAIGFDINSPLIVYPSLRKYYKTMKLITYEEDDPFYKTDYYINILED